MRVSSDLGLNYSAGPGFQGSTGCTARAIADVIDAHRVKPPIQDIHNEDIIAQCLKFPSRPIRAQYKF